MIGFNVEPIWQNYHLRIRMIYGGNRKDIAGIAKPPNSVIFILSSRAPGTGFLIYVFFIWEIQSCAKSSKM